MDHLIRKLIYKYKTNDPFQLSACLDIGIMHCDLGQNTRGIYIKKLWRRYIILHEDLNEPWQRFVCAHELAHDRLHPGINRFWMDERTLFSAGKFERQANRFATSLLLAGAELLPGESIADFCRRHDVPEEMHEYYQPIQVTMF